MHNESNSLNESASIGCNWVQEDILQIDCRRVPSKGSYYAEIHIDCKLVHVMNCIITLKYILTDYVL